MHLLHGDCCSLGWMWWRGSFFTMEMKLWSSSSVFCSGHLNLLELPDHQRAFPLWQGTKLLTLWTFLLMGCFFLFGHRMICLTWEFLGSKEKSIKSKFGKWFTKSGCGPELWIFGQKLKFKIIKIRELLIQWIKICFSQCGIFFRLSQSKCYLHWDLVNMHEIFTRAITGCPQVLFLKASGLFSRNMNLQSIKSDL